MYLIAKLGCDHLEDRMKSSDAFTVCSITSSQGRPVCVALATFHIGLSLGMIL